MTTIAEQEGVIKYDLDFNIKPPLPQTMLATLNAWRTILYRLRLIGQSPGLYNGLGYGNISQRLKRSNKTGKINQFVISGTQTGASELLQPAQYCLVTQVLAKQNRIIAEGPVKPSSETLTHGSIYQTNEQIDFIMHVHCAEIWRNTEALKIPRISKKISYGTPEMAAEVENLVRMHPAAADGCIFSMLGHEDGIVSYGYSAEAAGRILINTLAEAFKLSH